MCGISGIINKSRPVEIESIVKFNSIIRHRGPDDEGYAFFNHHSQNFETAGGKDTPDNVWQTDTNYKPINLAGSNHQNWNVLLGHRRLSILDLSPAGHLPMCDTNKRFWITYNGEVYNFIEIRNELIKQGVSFTTQTDTEVILKAYIVWGPECLNRFVGMFAFAIYDNENKEIFLARDRFGIKPLYYWFAPDGSFCFGSEIKQFTVVKGWRARLNGQRAYDYLFYSLTDHTDETMFAGVYHIPPSHYYKEKVADIKSSGGKINPTLWYKLPENKSTNTFSEATDEFKRLFKAAVKIHLRSDVPVGSALSGGLDSTAVVCEVNNLLNEEGKKELQKTFSSVSHDERYSEKKWVDEVIKETAVDANFVYPSYEKLFELTPKILWHMDEPYQSQATYLGYHVFECAKQHGIKVLLNGQGADEYLSAYGQYKEFRWRTLAKKLRLKKLNKDFLGYGIKNFRSKLINFSRQILLLGPAPFLRFFSRKSPFYKGIKKTLSIKKLKARELHPYNQIPYKYSSVYNIASLQLFHNPLPRYLRWEDRNSMANSIEARVPFLDHRMVEYVISQPVEFLDGANESKRLLLHGLRDILPTSIFNRKDKMGFITPEERWLKIDYTKELRKKLEETILVCNGIFKQEVLTYFDDVVGGKIEFDYTYWRIILFGEWIKVFKVDID